VVEFQVGTNTIHLDLAAMLSRSIAAARASPTNRRVEVYTRHVNRRLDLPGHLRPHCKLSFRVSRPIRRSPPAYTKGLCTCY
jgi:hypothetical protein